MARASSAAELKAAGAARRAELSFADLETDFVEVTTPPAETPQPAYTRDDHPHTPRPITNSKENFIMDKLSDFYLAEALDKRQELPPAGASQKFAIDLLVYRAATVFASKPGVRPQNVLLGSTIELAKHEKRLAISYMKLIMRDIAFRAHLDTVQALRRSTAGDAELAAMRSLRDGVDNAPQVDEDTGEIIGFDPTRDYDAPSTSVVADFVEHEHDRDQPERPNDTDEIERAVLRVQAYMGQLAHALMPKERDRAYWRVDGEFPLTDEKVELPGGAVYTPVTSFAAARELFEREWRKRDAKDIARLEKADAFAALRA